MGNLKFPMRQASISLFGRLTRDTELKYDEKGQATVGFSVAVERYAGPTKGRVSWFANCRSYGKQAEKFASQAVKGSSVFVTGEPYMDDYTTQAGEKRKEFKVMVSTADLMEWPDDGKQERPAPRAANQKPVASAPVDDEIPF